MPELPEVEVTRRGLLPHISGRVISGVEIREPRLRWPVPPAVRRLAGRTIRSIRRRGKYLLVDCGDGHLILHLGMSGSLRLLPPGTPAGKHDHFDLLLGDRILRLRDPRRFGAVLWAPGRVEAHPLLAHLGLEPLSRALHPERLHAVARALRPACRRNQGNLARRDPRRRLEPARLRRSRRQPGLFPAALLGVRTRGPALQAMRERDSPHRAGAALYFFLPALSALAALAFSRFSTTGSTNFDTSPPNAAISRTSVAEMNMCCSEGVRKMVSRSG